MAKSLWSQIHPGNSLKNYDTQNFTVRYCQMVKIPRPLYPCVLQSLLCHASHTFGGIIRHAIKNWKAHLFQVCYRRWRLRLLRWGETRFVNGSIRLGFLSFVFSYRSKVVTSTWYERLRVSISILCPQGGRIWQCIQDQKQNPFLWRAFSF